MDPVDEEMYRLVAFHEVTEADAEDVALVILIFKRSRTSSLSIDSFPIRATRLRSLVNKYGEAMAAELDVRGVVYHEEERRLRREHAVANPRAKRWKAYVALVD